MYKLENNVEWTEELKDAFKHGITRATIQYDDGEMNENSNIKEVTLNDKKYVKDLGFIGQAPAKQLKFTFFNRNLLINLENKEVTLKIGADYQGKTFYINYGNFIVNSAPENDDTNYTTSVTAYDYMIKFNQPYQDRLTYPCELYQILDDVCEQAGVVNGTKEFPNMHFIVENNQFKDKTLRDVLKNIAKCAFSWARIGQDNKLYLDFKVDNNITETLTNDEYKQDSFKRANEYFGPLNQVIYADSDITGQEEKVSDEEAIARDGIKELAIYDNLFAYTEAKRKELIQAGKVLFGLKYMPITQLDLIGTVYLDCNDILGVNDGDDNLFITRNFNHTIKYNGVVSDSIVSESSSETEQKYKNTATNTLKNAITEISVDKANKKIAAIVSQIGDRSKKTTTITADIDGLQSKVEHTEDFTSDTIEGTTTIKLTNCFKGELIELHIFGNNTVFEYLSPSGTLFPSKYLLPSKKLYPSSKRSEPLLPADDLLPYGDSEIIVTGPNGETTTYELGVLDVLRQAEGISDEYVYKNGHAQVIRRIGEDGKKLAKEVIEDLGEYHIYIYDGDNTIKIKNYEANLNAKYPIKNNYSDIFATKVEMKSSIEQAADEINISVDKKLENYSTTEEMNAAIKTTSDTITANVTKQISTAKTEAIDSANSTTDEKLKDYSTTSEMNSAIKLSADTLSAQISDIENVTKEVDGTKTIILENAKSGALTELHIFGNNNVFKPLLPANDLLPADDLLPAGDSLITVTDSSGNITEYELGILDTLRANEDTRDEFVLKNGSAKVIRRISTTGTIKEKETTEELGNIYIGLSDGTNTISIKNYSANMSATYATINNFTNIFATTVETNSKLELTNSQFNVKLSKKLDNTEFSSAQILQKINDDGSETKIKSDKIKLEGATTIGDKIKFNLDGSATFQDVKLLSGGRIIGGDGLMTNLFFESTGPLAGGFSQLGYQTDLNNIFQKAGISLNTYIPDNFKIVHAYLTLITNAAYWELYSESGTWTGWGYARNLKLYKGTDLPRYYLGWASEYYTDFSRATKSEIANAFGSSTYTSTSTSEGSPAIVTTKDIANSLKNGQQSLYIETIDEPSGDVSDFNNSKDKALKTGIGKAFVNIIGYMNYD